MEVEKEGREVQPGNLVVEEEDGETELKTRRMNGVLVEVAEMTTEIKTTIVEEMMTNLQVGMVVAGGLGERRGLLRGVVDLQLVEDHQDGDLHPGGAPLRDEVLLQEEDLHPGGTLAIEIVEVVLGGLDLEMHLKMDLEIWEETIAEATGGGDLGRGDLHLPEGGGRHPEEDLLQDETLAGMMIGDRHPVGHLTVMVVDQVRGEGGRLLRGVRHLAEVLLLVVKVVIVFLRVVTMVLLDVMMDLLIGDETDPLLHPLQHPLLHQLLPVMVHLRLKMCPVEKVQPSQGKKVVKMKAGPQWPNVRVLLIKE